MQTPPKLPTRKESNRLQVLIKRHDWISSRIANSPKDLSYDRAESTALQWAIEHLLQCPDRHLGFPAQETKDAIANAR